MNNYKFIDLFAGIGGIRIPFDELGCQCVFSSEIDKFSRIVYEANYNHIPAGDITQIKEEEIPSFDILLGGFPCQAFSIAGKRQGFEDTRGTLFFDVARIIKYHKPKAFLLENVKGLLSHDKGNTFETIINTLNEIGYKVFYKVLSANDFGVPQKRERIYIIGFLDNNIEFEFPKPLEKEVKLGDILENSVDLKYTISDKLWAGHLRRKEEHKRKGNGFGFGLFNENSSYTNTISARYYKDGSEILIEQPGNNPRKLSPREALRLQGFPESFKIVVSDMQTYKQVGNSVSVPVIRAIAKNMIFCLNNNKNLNETKICNLTNIKEENMIEVLNEEKQLKISDDRYMHNLKAYSILKNLIQIKLTDNQINSLIEILLLLKDTDLSKLDSSLENMISENVWFKSKSKVDTVQSLFLENIYTVEDVTLFSLLLKLILFKDYILQLSKVYENKYIIQEDSNTFDILSLKYDNSNLYKPYSLRIAGSLLIKSAFLLENKEIIKGTMLESLLKEYNSLKSYIVDADILLQIIFNESASQSAKSTGGSIYEERVIKYLISKGFNLLGKSHDSKINAVEYDNVIELDSKEKIGISMKRTLRERYKQNHENIEDLDIDLMIIITLGIDLNMDKLKNIVSKKGNIVFIANDIFDKWDNKSIDLNKNNCYKISDLSIDFFKSYLKGI